MNTIGYVRFKHCNDINQHAYNFLPRKNNLFSFLFNVLIIKVKI